MTYYQFIHAVEEKIKKEVKEERKISVHTNIKNNGVKRTGIMISENGINISPTIYLETGEVTPTGLPNSNVLYYELTDDAWVCVRPSGTEPKVKFYYGVKGTSLADADEKSDAMGKAVLEMVDSMK